METKEFNDLLIKTKYDKSAITRIYQEYAPNVKLHLFRRFGDAVDVDDIVHEVFMKLMLIDWSKYKPVKSPSAWLFKIADHLALDKIKKQHIDYSIEDYEDSFSYFDLEKLMIMEDVKTALSYLDKVTAKIIYLNKYEGYKFNEIAAMLSMKPIAVRVRASRGYKKLEKICNKFHLDFV